MQNGKKPTPSPEQIPTPGGVTSGVGPAIQWPTGTDPLIDSGKWVALQEGAEEIIAKGSEADYYEGEE